MATKRNRMRTTRNLRCIDAMYALQHEVYKLLLARPGVTKEEQRQLNDSMVTVLTMRVALLSMKSHWERVQGFSR